MASSATFVISIDESGQEGEGGKPGTSRWFVMSGAIFRRTEEMKQLELLDEGDGSLEIVFSQGHNLKADVQRRFVDELTDENSPFFLPAALGVLRPNQTTTFKPGKRMGLQIADVVASSYFFAVEPSEWGLVEDGYARLLRPCAYCHNEEVWQHGICLVTERANEARKRGELFAGWER